MQAANEILLITRLTTLNKGNQALSAAWLSALQRAFPSSGIRVFERRPRHLLQYTLARIASSRDPVAAFDTLATRLAQLAPGPGLLTDPPTTTRIRLDESTSPPVRFVEARRLLNLRGRLASLGRYREDYRRRLSACQRARLVVVNPAGEFFPREPQAAFYHVLDAHVAQKLGRPTAIVNHTMDITDPTLRKIIPHVYRTLALVGFRDEKSAVAFRAMGGDASNVFVTPDLALLTEIGAPSARRPNTVAVAINVPEARAGGYLGQWSRAIGELRAARFEVKLVSNELPADQPFYTELLERFGDLRLEGQGLDHDRYSELLGGFDVVVTSRMHTGVLAMIAGTPVVPVEGSSFKITGLFSELQLAEPVIDPSGPDWPARLAARAVALRDARATASTEISQKIGAARERILRMLLPRLQSAAGRSS